MPGLRDRDAVQQRQPCHQGCRLECRGRGRPKGQRSGVQRDRGVDRNPSRREELLWVGGQRKEGPSPQRSRREKCKGPEAGARWVSLTSMVASVP